MERFQELMGRVNRLRARLRDQTQQTQQTAQQKHDAVLETINRHGGVPEGIDPQGHPIEQIVGSVLSARDDEIDRLRGQLLRVARWAYCNSCHNRGWRPYFDLDSKVDEILRPWLDEMDAKVREAVASLGQSQEEHGDG